MKKILLLLTVFFALVAANAQQVERDMVVLEIGTGTWCTYCPGAAMGAEDLIANGKDVAVIENHNGDSYANTYSNARNNYYGISSLPTAKFDGILTVSGGSHSQSMYSSYLPKYNQRKAIPSSFTIEMYGGHNGADYNLYVKVKKVAACTSTNMKLRVTLTQSNIACNWQGQTELNYVNRLMMPNATGTVVSLDPTDSTQTVNLTFTLNSAYPVEDCELSAFIQDETSKEILQGTKVALTDLPSGTMQADFSSDVTTVCQGNTVHFYDNTSCDPPTSTWNWSFPGGEPDSSIEQNPAVTYPVAGSYSVSLIVSNGSAIDTLTRSDFITVSNPPTAFEVTGGGNYCEGGDGVVIGLAGSENNVLYLLYKDDVATEDTIRGDGNAINFEKQTAIGIYTVKAIADGILCEQTMQGSVEVTINPLPGIPETPAGNSDVCVYLEPTTDYTTTETANALTYAWELSPAEAGTISGDGITATATWNTAYFGAVTIKVKGVNDCGESIFSNDKNVNILLCDDIAENNPMLPTILPNPNNGQFNLNWSAGFTGKVNIKVVNAFNALVYEAKGVNVNGTTMSLNISNLSSGVYFLIIENNHSVKAQKFIIQK